MKRSFKYPEIPIGSAIRRKCDCGLRQMAVVAIDVGGVTLATGIIWTYQQLFDEAEIKRPTDTDWQPCRVDEFSPSDYQPGQEVDWITARKLKEVGVVIEYREINGQWSAANHLPAPIPSTAYRIALPPFDPSQYKPGQEVDVATARKLHAAGVSLDVQDKGIKPGWASVAGYVLNYTDEHLASFETKFRIAARPKLRDIRPDELPERFEVVYPSQLRLTWDRSEVDAARIQKWITKQAGYRTDLTSNELKSFTVEDK